MYDSEKFAEFETRAVKKSSGLEGARIGFNYTKISELFQKNNFYILGVDCGWFANRGPFINSVAFRKKNSWDCPAWQLQLDANRGIRLVGMYPDPSGGSSWKPLFLGL
jgi:hypothetical protein